MQWIRRIQQRSAERRETRRDILRSVAADLGGDYHEGKNLIQDRVELMHGPWLVTLGAYQQSNGQATVTYTRVRAYVGGWRELRVTVRKRNAFDRIFESLGFVSRLPLGRAITDRYVISGKPRARVPSLFASGVTSALMALHSVRLEVKRPSRKSRRQYGEDAGVVVARTTGLVTEHGRLVGMVTLVQETLTALNRIGEANQREIH